MFTSITLSSAQPEGTIAMKQQIFNRQTNRQETLFTEYVTPAQAEACKIPAKQELVLDFAKIAELQAWHNELLAKFGK